MKNEINKIIAKALSEDIGARDITTASLIPENQTSQAKILLKEHAVICGLDLAKKTFRKLDKSVKFYTRFKDGKHVQQGTVIATITGKTRALLTGERVALNFLSYLSGIATTTQKYVQKTRSTKTKILDTRKTTPGQRFLERYAVRCGGGINHRFNLNSMVMIKDNHRSACHPGLSIPGAIKKIRKQTKKLIEVEIDTLGQLKLALKEKPDIILLDNMNIARIKQAIKIVNQVKGRKPLLEASGEITLNNISPIAKTGVDRISIGALTHSRQSIDVSMEIIA